MNYFRRTFGLIAVPASLVILVGCSSATAPNGTGQTSAAQQTNAPATQALAQRARRPRGPAVMVLKSALADLSLDATQKKTIQGIIGQLKPVRGPAHAAFRHALAQAVRSGNVNPASFTDQYAAIEKQVKQRIDQQASALDQLHATLDSADRGLLVDQLKADFAKHRFARHERHGRWMRKATGATAMQEPAIHGMRRHGPRMMRGFMAHKLGLSQAQIQKLHDLAPAVQEKKQGECAGHMHARGAEAKKLMAAFVSDNFKAENLINADAMAKRAASFAQRRVEHLSRLVSVLTPSQRTQLANMLDRRAGAKP